VSTVQFDDPRVAVAATCRGLAAYGLGSEIGGHVSVRSPGEDAYWINALDRTFEEMTPADVVQLDFDGNQLDGDRIVSLGADFHEGIYRNRDDVHAIVHSHGPWITLLCALARPVKVWHNLSSFFHEECAMSDDDTFEAIAPSLGTKSTILIPYHGAITVSDSLARATALHVTLEYAAELDVRMAAVADAQPMPPGMITRVKELVTKAGYLDLEYDLVIRKAARAVAAAGEDWLAAPVR
jgi:L-fuculose-phosphate aldolase